ncbi:alpha/beta hydrolase [Rhodocytophaga rosea]|uniref:Alpha/beta hydrolase n=1 Tax=Rhodocytophaga rosea TaxID=2704465 RepID=A0A6C0GLF1_9BACT|nr:alpha/beta fold hydrolase [Rhodocytophaga rosea]QHT68866.1 alpha/beta hydrolase [Rhodocytophaga rosea]
MQTHIFTYQQASLSYNRLGSGNQILLVFHGFGQNKSYFRHLAATLSTQYTVYTFDLFYHGQSVWPLPENPLTKTFWAEWLKAFLKQEQIEKFSLLGFSMGGKFVLATLESFSDRISKLILIAPDGVKTSFWYSLATYPGWTSNYFRKMVTSPDAFSRLVGICYKLRLVDKGIIRFAASQMDTPEKRRKVYNTWMLCRQLRFNMKHIAQLINYHQIQVYIFLGSYDRIITRKNMLHLLKKLTKYELVMLQTGHNQLIDEVTKYMSANRI